MLAKRFLYVSLGILALSIAHPTRARTNEGDPGAGAGVSDFGIAKSERLEPPSLDPTAQAQLGTWLDAEGKAPERYVAGLFAGHDVVFLGEWHRVKHDCLLIQSLIRSLPEAGVRVLATEFGRREDQPLIDSLLELSEWDENLAREIVFRQYVFWGYQEYIDIYRSAWEQNRAMRERGSHFRILGLNNSPDWSLIRSESDRDNPKIMREVWRGTSEEHWAGVILDAVHSGEKVLVHCGMHHAFTKYRQPKVSGGEFKHFDPDLRCGNHVFSALGKRAFTVCLHAPWPGPEGYDSSLRHPADGVIDALMLARGPRAVGFDVAGGPFGEIRIRDAVYRHGYDDFKLADFCDGWIYTKPLSSSEGVTPISQWVNEGTLGRARAQSPNPRFRDAPMEWFNIAIARDADIPRRWGHLR